jgi:hypothetical protein
MPVDPLFLPTVEVPAQAVRTDFRYDGVFFDATVDGEQVTCFLVHDAGWEGFSGYEEVAIARQPGNITRGQGQRIFDANRQAIEARAKGVFTAIGCRPPAGHLVTITTGGYSVNATPAT